MKRYLQKVRNPPEEVSTFRVILRAVSVSMVVFSHHLGLFLCGTTNYFTDLFTPKFHT